MNVAIMPYIGEEVSAARKRMSLLKDDDYHAVKDALATYRCESYSELEERLVSDGICVFGHNSLISDLIRELTNGDNHSQKVTHFCELGCEVSVAKERIPLFHEQDYDIVKEKLRSFYSYSQGILNKSLEAAKTCVYGDTALISKLIADLTTTSRLSNEHTIVLYLDEDNAKEVFSVKKKEVTAKDLPDLDQLMADFETHRSKWPFNVIVNKFVLELLQMIVSGSDVGVMTRVVAFMTEQKLYPRREQMEQLFDIAFAKYKSLEEGEQKQRFNEFCWGLKDMLRFVFTH